MLKMQPDSIQLEEDLRAEIGISPADPVRPGRAEHVKIYSVFQRFRGMRNIPRDYEDFPGPHDHLSPRQGELQRAFEDIGDLFILVAVQRHDTACAKYQPCQHALFTRDKLPIKQRIQMLRGHIFKANVLDVRQIFSRDCAHPLVNPFASAIIAIRLPAVETNKQRVIQEYGGGISRYERLLGMVRADA
jgi:hypothetical protein